MLVTSPCPARNDLFELSRW